MPDNIDPNISIYTQELAEQIRRNQLNQLHRQFEEELQRAEQRSQNLINNTVRPFNLQNNYNSPPIYYSRYQDMSTPIAKKVSKTNVIKKIMITVNTETEEIIEGEEELKKYIPISTSKMNKKEEAIINVRELADFLALQEADKQYIKFDVEKDKERYLKLYEKHYRTIIRFKQQ